MKRLLLACLLPVSLAFAGELISVGVKGGVPFTDAFKTASTGQLQYVQHTQRYTVGPTLDINLPAGFGIEADLLYRRLRYDSSGELSGLSRSSATTANAWDLPLLLKWRPWPTPLVKPYISAGPTFRGLTNLKQRIQLFASPSQSTTTTTNEPDELSRRFNTGFTLSAGLQLGAAGVRLSPEVRYTRWGWRSFSEISGLLKSNSSQLDFLVGLTF
ncbi:MAG: porin family protein [Bryobacteraceae bacterium]|jgi:opacity protein-like surface antigen